jgi:hypothetical protein
MANHKKAKFKIILCLCSDVFSSYMVSSNLVIKIIYIYTTVSIYY